MTKRTLLLGAGIALGLGIAARCITALTAPAGATPPKRSADGPLADSPAQTMTPGQNGFRWREAWSLSTPDLCDFSLAPTGEGLNWVDSDGCVRRVALGTGQTLWHTDSLPGVNGVVAAPDGSAAAFSRLNPQKCTLTLLDPTEGDRYARQINLSGAVWSAAFDAHSVAWLGSGDRELTDGRAIVHAPRVATAGIPDSLAITTSDSGASRLVLGTWQPAQIIGCTTDSNQPCWKQSAPYADDRVQVQISRDGSRVLVVSARGPEQTKPELTIRDGHTGETIWAMSLPDGAYRPVATLSDDGRYIAATYMRAANPPASGAPEAKLILVDPTGRHCFHEKGSALFRPHVVALSADGAMVTVQSGKDTLFTLNRRGNFISKLRLRADSKTGVAPTILRTICSRDGRTLLLYRDDAKLTLLRAM